MNFEEFKAIIDKFLQIWRDIFNFKLPTSYLKVVQGVINQVEKKIWGWSCYFEPLQNIRVIFHFQLNQIMHVQNCVQRCAHVVRCRCHHYFRKLGNRPIVLFLDKVCNISKNDHFVRFQIIYDFHVLNFIYLNPVILILFHAMLFFLAQMWWVLILKLRVSFLDILDFDPFKLEPRLLQIIKQSLLLLILKIVSLQLIFDIICFLCNKRLNFIVPHKLICVFDKIFHFFVLVQEVSLVGLSFAFFIIRLLWKSYLYIFVSIVYKNNFYQYWNQIRIKLPIQNISAIFGTNNDSKNLIEFEHIVCTYLHSN